MSKLKLKIVEFDFNHETHTKKYRLFIYSNNNTHCKMRFRNGKHF